ncbi:hypothetical protein [Actinoplanes sp. N902-109]|uniref:hypothetical protein n=1 Tax=Actinoplanes sp. (strain N902-109) TaxID=649831 RepID=UPI000329664E|nr:hypothetical protein [Actinoplanes sp. N902-109]AGL17393.1 hypothetical protein L083_3883 [Actinoplanes sp. N902-109]
MLAVAHRAGNSVAGLGAALAAGVDLVEADVHLRRGVLEVRHHRALGPGLLWERGQPLTRRRDLVMPELRDILAVAARAGAPGAARLMLDLKGRSVAVAARVAQALRAEAPGMPVAVCTKQWEMLDAFAGDPGVRRIYSASNAVQVARLRSRVRRGPVDGVSVRLRLLTEPVVAELRRSTDLVLAWPVDTEADLARARRAGATGVVSKNLPMLTRLAQQNG